MASKKSVREMMFRGIHTIIYIRLMQIKPTTNTMMALALFAFCTFVPITQTFAQPNNSKDQRLANSLDSLVKSISTPFNGNVLAAVDGHVILKKSYGFTDFKTREKLNDSSLFDLASVSKPFTAMAIMLLQRKGKLTYDDNVSKYFPDLPYAGVTIRHLLNHTSGIPDYDEYALDVEKYFGSKKVLHNKDLLDILVRLKPPLQFKPGEKFSYSNTGYVILASIVTKVSGLEFNEFMTENIFRPLSMTRTRMFNTQREKGEKIANYAYGHLYSDSLKKFIIADEDPRWGKYVYAMDGIQGDGGLNSTTPDLYKWWQGLTQNKIVSKEMLEEAYQPAILSTGEKTVSGFGWFIESKPEVGKIIYHSGGHPGFGTYIIQFPELNGVFIVLSNNSGRGTKTLIKDVIRLYGNSKK